MKIARDKIAHLKAGAAALAAAAFATFLGREIGLHPYTVTVALCGISAGLAVEYAQHDSNARNAAAGLPAQHDVSLGDLIASALPAVLGAAAWEVAVRMGVAA